MALLIHPLLKVAIFPFAPQQISFELLRIFILVYFVADSE
jgi:hypothetical protein